jgi:hypothetical protein
LLRVTTRVMTSRQRHAPGASVRTGFQLYDQSALGRFDGENYNIGLIDTCHRVYEPLAAAASATHDRLYDVAAGLTGPFTAAPPIVERLNM